MKEALFRNDLDLVKEAISQGIDLNQLDEDGLAPLHIAASIGNTEIVKFLLDNGARIDLPTQIPCPIFSCYDCTTCASHRARFRNVCQKTSSDSPLHNAVESGRNEVCQLLIERGADINAVDFFGQTPLSRACHLININNNQFLRDLELFPETEDPVQKARAYLSRRDNILVITKTLIEAGVTLDVFDKFGHTALMIAALSNDLELVDLLLKNGAKLDTIREDNTALHIAVRENHFKIVKRFLECAASVDLRSFSAKTPLITAVADAAQPSVKMVELLIERGAKIDSRDCRERTIAHYAVARGLIDILKIIHKHAPQVLEQPNDEGCRPLHIAFFNKKWDVVRYLLDLDLEVYCRTKFEAFPTKITIVEMQTAPDDETTLFGKLTRELLQRGSCFQFEQRFFEVIMKPTMVSRLETLFQHVKDNDEAGVEEDIRQGVIINGRDAVGRTALHYATENKNEAIVKMLLKADIDLSLAEVKENKTALHMAIETGSESLVKIIIEHSKDKLSLNNVMRLLRVRTSEGKTALELAKQKQLDGIISLLMPTSDDPDIYDLGNALRSISFSNGSSPTMTKSGRDANVDHNNAQEKQKADYILAREFFAVANRLLSQYAQVKLVTDVEVSKFKCTEEEAELVDQFVELISKGMLIEAKTSKQGNTLLHLAPDLPIVQTLLRRGALYEMQNNNGQKPIDMAQSQEIKDLLNEVRKAFADTVLGQVILEKLPHSQAIAVRNARCRYRKQFQDYQKFYGMAEGYF